MSTNDDGARDADFFVAIVGGFFELPPEEFEKAKGLARRYGGALARSGLGLVVYYSDERSLEPHVVAGYVDAAPEEGLSGPIRVRFASAQRNEVHFAEQVTHPDLFEIKLFRGDHWEAPFYRSLVAADGVDAIMLMSGGHSTRVAGQIALARPLPILAVDEFGGAAAEVWSELGREDGYHPSSSTTEPEALVRLLKEELEADATAQALRAKEADALASEIEQLRAISSRVRQSVWTGISFVALAGVAAMGMGRSPGIESFTELTLFGLVAAGATGATARSLVWREYATAPPLSVLLGGIAGFVVGIAYLIPQWIGAPGVLAPEQGAVTSTDKIQFISAVLVALSAGVGFDTVFTRLKDQAADNATLPNLK